MKIQFRSASSPLSRYRMILTRDHVAAMIRDHRCGRAKGILRKVVNGYTLNGQLVWETH